MGPEREGLANTFGQYVAENAAEFSAQAAAMRGCSPIYVRTFVSKMDEAVKAGQPVDLPAILELCNWVVEQTATARVDSLRDDVESWIGAGSGLVAKSHVLSAPFVRLS